ncbi:MAG: PD-(D/E)XK nuclease domain-containing protein, partial [Planctomycetaceae bacterium]|nr:PD-(D/E)XK nuclease domain-containing protein [Planctomycetaceae bacterium]
KQIDDKGYSIPYQTTGKKIIKIGVEFDPETRTIGRWLVADKNKKTTKKVSKKVVKKVTKKVNPKTSKKVVKKSSGKKKS